MGMRYFSRGKKQLYHFLAYQLSPHEKSYQRVTLFYVKEEQTKSKSNYIVDRESVNSTNAFKYLVYINFQVTFSVVRKKKNVTLTFFVFFFSIFFFHKNLPRSWRDCWEGGLSVVSFISLVLQPIQILFHRPL